MAPRSIRSQAGQTGLVKRTSKKQKTNVVTTAISVDITTADGCLPFVFKVYFDVLLEICRYLHPRDLACMVATCRKWRDLLLCKGNERMWVNSLKVLEIVIPDRELIHPAEYCKRIFNLFCTLCNKHKTAYFLFNPLQRICSYCRDEHLQTASQLLQSGLATRDVLSMCHCLVVQRKRSEERWYRLSDVKEAMKLARSTKAASGEQEYNRVIETAVARVASINENIATALSSWRQYQDRCELEEEELRVMKIIQRQQEIITRLIQLGYDVQDVHFTKGTKAYALFHKAVTLSERAWPRNLEILRIEVERNRGVRLASSSEQEAMVALQAQIEREQDAHDAIDELYELMKRTKRESARDESTQPVCITSLDFDSLDCIQSVLISLDEGLPVEMPRIEEVILEVDHFVLSIKSAVEAMVAEARREFLADPTPAETDAETTKAGAGNNDSTSGGSSSTISQRNACSLSAAPEGEALKEGPVSNADELLVVACRECQTPLSWPAVVRHNSENHNCGTTSDSFYCPKFYLDLLPNVLSAAQSAGFPVRTDKDLESLKFVCGVCTYRKPMPWHTFMKHWAVKFYDGRACMADGSVPFCPKSVDLRVKVLKGDGKKKRVTCIDSDSDDEEASEDFDYLE